MKKSKNFLILYLFFIVFSLYCNASPCAEEDDLEALLREINPVVDNLYGDVIPTKKVAEASSLLRKYLYKHPDGENKPMVYYYLGIVYLRAKMYPEAFSYWKIVLEDFPESKAALDTINAINEIDKTGTKNQIMENFLRKTPDNYLGHTLAWVYLARNSLKEGNIEDVEKQLSFIESNRPELFIDVPILNKLKGDLLFKKGDIEGAKENWVKYANMIDDKQKRVIVFFDVAKVLMDINPSESKKYFLLVRSLDLESPQGLSTNFKIALLNLKEEKLLEGIVMEKREPLDYTRFQDRLNILEKSFPGHPIKDESFFDYMKILSLNDRIFESFKFMNDFMEKNNFEDNDSKKQLIEVIVNNLTLLQAKNMNLNILQDVNKKLFEIREKLKKIFKDIPEPAEDIIFKSFKREIQMLYDDKQYVEAIKKVMELQDNFLSKKQEIPYDLGKNALIKYDESVLDVNHMELLNYHYNYKDNLEFFNSPEHLFFVGNSWMQLGIPEEAQVNYYDSYSRKPESLVLVNWGDAAFKSRDFIVSKAIIDIYEGNYKDKQDAMDFMWLKYRFLHKIKKWDEFLRIGKNLKDKNLSEQFEPEFTLLYADGLINTAKWSEMQLLYKKIEPNLKEKEKKAILRKWGDYAFLNNQLEESMKVYGLLTDFQDKEHKDMMRYFIALRLTGSKHNLLEELRKFDVKDGFWGEAIEKIKSNEEKLKELSSATKAI